MAQPATVPTGDLRRNAAALIPRQPLKRNMSRTLVIIAPACGTIKTAVSLRRSGV